MTAAKTAAGAAARSELLRRLENRAPVTTSYKVTLDQGAVDALVDARLELLAAESALRDASDLETEPLQARVAEATAAERTAQMAVDDSSVTLKFEALPYRTFRTLLEQHEPTEAQLEKAKNDEHADVSTQYNVDTFRPALIAATCVDPGFDTVEQADDLLFGPASRFTHTEAVRIFSAALEACTTAREVTDWGKGSGETGA